MRRLLLLIFLCAATVRADDFRAFWVEAFRTPLATKDDVDRVLDAAVRANANALFVQVRRRGDSWYIDSAEPLSAERAVGAPDADGRWTFDPLRYLIDAAHGRRIQIHAFVIVGSIHNGDPTEPGGLPSDPNHIFLQHVWDAANGKPYDGARQWATRALPHNRSGVTFDGYRFANEWYLDLGHPEAASYTVEVLLHLVRAYDIDGLHLDRIRYPDAPVDKDGGSNVGYNDTSVGRFNAHYGRSGVPRPNDPLWSAWRREQVTQFVRRLYLSATAIKPTLNVSAALICYGAGPGKRFESSEAYWHVFQDWAAWAKEGIVDTLAPMMYKREHLPVQRAQFDGWLAFLMRTARASGRLAVPGIGAFMNSTDGALRQARRAAVAGADGVIFFAVGSIPKPPGDDFLSALRRGVFASSGAAPRKMLSKTGSVMGYTEARDGAVVTIESIATHAMRTTTTDGSGFFGVLGLEPGEYRVSLAGASSPVFPIVAGAVSRVDMAAIQSAAAAVVRGKGEE
ncbi:MAG TPA: family 10 glycosylhydrolase [Thermoanaerobaculia bacterium]|nr:family 10 glycosylhydrolase [Thermoanaerobaculia bacterium]